MIVKELGLVPRRRSVGKTDCNDRGKTALLAPSDDVPSDDEHQEEYVFSTNPEASRPFLF